MRGDVYVGLGSILYLEGGTPLLEVVEDTIGRHDDRLNQNHGDDVSDRDINNI